MRNRLGAAVACLAAALVSAVVALGCRRGSDSATVNHAIQTGGGRHSHVAGGRTGNLPRNLVTGADAQDVAAFVAANASGSSTP